MAEHGTGGDGRVNEAVAALRPWTVVHLHGDRTAAHDGWTESASRSGQTQVPDYANDQRATLLWYHDHAMGITRFNVYAGLAGLSRCQGRRGRRRPKRAG